MKNFEKLLIGVVNDYADDYDAEAVLEEFFPGATIGEIILEMYNAGLIPDDKVEKFVND